MTRRKCFLKLNSIIIYDCCGDKVEVEPYFSDSVCGLRHHILLPKYHWKLRFPVVDVGDWAYEL